MMVDAYLRDGRTVLRFRSRKLMRDALDGKVIDIADKRWTLCWRRFVVPTALAPDHLNDLTASTRWEQIKIHHLAHANVATVIAIEGEAREAFEAEFPDAIDKAPPRGRIEGVEVHVHEPAAGAGGPGAGAAGAAVAMAVEMGRHRTQPRRA